MKALRRLVIMLLALPGVTNVNATEYRSKYIGEEKRQIKSLSADDIEQLKAGQGWGLAKAAELNGMPGPSHLLQMKQEIALSDKQQKKIRTIFNAMKAKAIPLGNELIRLEKELNNAFANKTINKKQLKDRLEKIADVKAQLRFVHLQTHLMTPEILSQRQIDDYNRLRGYSDGDPCLHIPNGHNAEMWKKHNGCS